MSGFYLLPVHENNLVNDRYNKVPYYRRRLCSSSCSPDEYNSPLESRALNYKEIKFLGPPTITGLCRHSFNLIPVNHRLSKSYCGLEKEDTCDMERICAIYGNVIIEYSKNTMKKGAATRHTISKMNYIFRAVFGLLFLPRK